MFFWSGHNCPYGLEKEICRLRHKIISFLLLVHELFSNIVFFLCVMFQIVLLNFDNSLSNFHAYYASYPFNTQCDECFLLLWQCNMWLQYIFFSILNMSNFCCFRIAHGSHGGYKWIMGRGWNFFYRLKSVGVKGRGFYKNITMERNNRKKYLHID